MSRHAAVLSASPFMTELSGAGRGGLHDARALRRRAGHARRRRPRGRSIPTSCRSTPTTTCLIVNDSITPAVGEITHLGGRILDAKGNPIRNALVEIWQVDGNGAYLHTGDPNRQEARHQLPGLRPLPDRLDRRVLLPHDQAGRLPRPDAAHPLQDQEGRTRNCSPPSATSRARPATRRTASIRSITRPEGPRLA